MTINPLFWIAERMVDQDERPFEIVHRWINQGFKLAMEEKWRFLFTFTEEAQDRLARQTKKILFSQVRSLGAVVLMHSEDLHLTKFPR